MSIIKIMPCLDMKEGRVVKGIHFVDLKDAGDPVENAAYYQKEGADELAMLDIAATLENRKTRLAWVKNVSSVIDLQLTVGGGISTLEDIEMVLEAGADKISMNTLFPYRRSSICRERCTDSLFLADRTGRLMFKDQTGYPYNLISTTTTSTGLGAVLGNVYGRAAIITLDRVVIPMPMSDPAIPNIFNVFFTR